jgi:uncharacterized membrane protein
MSTLRSVDRGVVDQKVPPAEKWPVKPPSRETYAQWVADRIERTKAVMLTQKSIPGAQVKQQNLSMKLLYQNGYVLDATTDTMVKS